MHQEIAGQQHHRGVGNRVLHLSDRLIEQCEVRIAADPCRVFIAIEGIEVNVTENEPRLVARSRCGDDAGRRNDGQQSKREDRCSKEHVYGFAYETVVTR